MHKRLSLCVGERLEPRHVLDSVVVFNELMYHPADQDTRGEWIELRNLLSVDVDMSGWSLQGGVNFRFQDGAKIPADGFLLVAAQPAAWAGSPISNIQGPLVGSLNNAGEEVRLYNNSQRVMDTIAYEDQGAWPVAADGIGVSLSKIDPYWTSLDPQNWATSAKLRGTPGAENFPEFDSTPITSPVVALTSSWRYLDTGSDPGSTWKDPGFSDANWPEGKATFFAGVQVGQGVDLRVSPLAANSDADLGDGRAYTHLLDFGNVDSGGEVNGARFTQVTTANYAQIPNFAWTNSSGIRTQGRPTGATPVDGPLRELVQDYMANTINAAGGTVSVTLTGLTPGTRYQTRLFSRKADANPRPVTLQFDHGAGQVQSLSIDQNAPPIDRPDDPYVIEYTFTAATSQVTITATQTESTRPWLWYALANEIVQATGTTELRANVKTQYFRQTFPYAGDPAADHALELRLLVDDGAVVYLNGQEIHRSNMPAGDISPTTAALTNMGDTVLQPPILLPASALRFDQPNVLAVEVHQAAGGEPDVRFAASMSVIETPRPPVVAPSVKLNEIAASGSTERWLELINDGTAPVELSSLRLEQHGAAIETIPLPTQTISPQQTVLVTVPSGLRSWQDVSQLVLFDASRSVVVDAQLVRDTLQGRRWDAGMEGRWETPSVATPGGANRLDVVDSIVINEIMYHAAPQYRTGDQAYQEVTDEWIELFNRGTQPVDLAGWSLAGGLDFVFAPGTTLAAGAYLVVSNNAAQLAVQWPAATIVGNFAGRLRDSQDLIVLRDARGNTADEVHYYDSGTWPLYADGGGSSLELRDPWADNRAASAWSASDETDKAPWVSITYEGLATAAPGSSEPRQWHELILGLLDAGEILLDDVSVIESPEGAAIERMQNGSFEDGGNKWRFVGSHGQHGLTQTIVDPDNAQNHVLHLVATGATEHMSNHIETTFGGGGKVDPTKNYRISFKARWLAGSPQLHSRLYFNRLAGLHILPQPQHTGTPGLPNSTRIQNFGPTYSELAHWPVIPDAGQTVEVTVRAADAQGLREVRLFYARDGQAFQSVLMQTTTDGLYRGTIPGFNASQIVQFYVEGTDSQGAVTQFPEGGPNSRALYRVNDGKATDGVRHNLRIIMTNADMTEMLRPANVTSNERKGATVIWQESKVYHNVEVRFKGSGYSRGSDATGFNLRFSPDQLLFGEHDVVAVDRQGGPWGIGASHRELTIKHIANRAGDIPMMYDDVIQLIGPRDQYTGSAQFLVARYDDVFLDSQWENGSDGTRFKYDLIYYSTTTIDGKVESFKTRPSAVLGIDMAYMGTDPNAYRWNFLIRNHRDRDDYAPIIALMDAFRTTGTTVGGDLDLKSQAAMDVDQWMRVFAFESLAGINDTYNQGLAHNLQLYVRPSDQRVLALPWDMDFSLHQPTNMAIYGTGSRLSRIINIPTNRRVFQQHLLDIIQTAYNADYLTSWVRHLGSRSQQDNSTDILNYINARRTYVLGRLAPQIPFEITTPDKDNLRVDTPFVTLEGRGWIDVRDVRRVGQELPLTVKWLDGERWQVQVPLQLGEQTIDLQAFNRRGELVGSASAKATSSVTSGLAGGLRITEIQYNPAAPSVSEQAAGWIDADEFEFIELTNIGASPLDVTGVKLVENLPDGTTSGIAFTMPTQILAAGGSVVVARNSAAFNSRYGNRVQPLGPFTGQLSNGGELLTLVGPHGDVIQQFAYDDGWYPHTDGQGPSLQIRSATTTASTDWNQASAWMASPTGLGSPGQWINVDINGDSRLNDQDIDLFCAALQTQNTSYDFDEDRSVDLEDLIFLVAAMNARVGDVNFDGRFDSADLVSVFQADQYEDTTLKNSKWVSGDWNCDGDFNSSDLVFALQNGEWTA